MGEAGGGRLGRALWARPNLLARRRVGSREELDPTYSSVARLLRRHPEIAHRHVAGAGVAAHRPAAAWFGMAPFRDHALMRTGPNPEIRLGQCVGICAEAQHD